MIGLTEAVQMTALLTTTVERGPGTLLMPVAGGLLAALAIVAFFIRFAAKKGEMDRKQDSFGKRKKR